MRDATRKSHGVSASLKLVCSIREALTRCASFHSGASGLGPWRQMLASPVIVKPKTRRPELDKVVRTLWISEQFLKKPFPVRQCKKCGVHPWTLAAMWWAVLTSQRTGAAFALLKSDLVTDTLAPEKWQRASWEPEKMKGKQRFVLPVPKQAIDHLNRFLGMGMAVRSPVRKAGTITRYAQTGWKWPQRNPPKATHPKMPARPLWDTVRSKMHCANSSVLAIYTAQSRYHNTDQPWPWRLQILERIARIDTSV